MTEFTRRKILSFIGSMSTLSIPGFLDSGGFDGKIQSIDYPGNNGAKIHVIEGGDVTEDRIDRVYWKRFVQSTLAHSGHYLPDLGEYRLFRFYYTDSNDFHLGFKSESTMVNIYKVNNEFDYVSNIHDFDSDLEIDLMSNDFDQHIQEIKSEL